MKTVGVIDHMPSDTVEPAAMSKIGDFSHGFGKKLRSFPLFNSVFLYVSA